MKIQAVMQDLRKDVKPFLLLVFVVAPFCAFFFGFSVSVLSTFFSYFIIYDIYGIFGAMTATICVSLSYLTLRRYNKAVAIIYCTSGTLVFALIPCLVTLSGNPISWVTGMLGYLVGLSLLNFSIGVSPVEAFCNRLRSFFVEESDSSASESAKSGGMAREIGTFLLAIFVVGPFFGFCCGLMVGVVDVLFLEFKTHLNFAVISALSAVVLVALSYPFFRKPINQGYLFFVSWRKH